MFLLGRLRNTLDNQKGVTESDILLIMIKIMGWNTKESAYSNIWCYQVNHIV